MMIYNNPLFGQKIMSAPIAKFVKSHSINSFGESITAGSVDHLSVTHALIHVILSKDIKIKR